MRCLVHFVQLAGALALLGACGAPDRRPPEAVGADIARGGELYRTYCNACHTEQVRWREKSLVKSWDDLRDQVTRWQRTAGQNWSREEIEDVAAFLNRHVYDVPCPLPGCNGAKAGIDFSRRARID